MRTGRWSGLLLFIHFRSVAFRITVFEEFVILVMRGVHTPGMLNGAPELLGTRRDLPCIGDDAVAIAAVDAVQFLYGVQATPVSALGTPNSLSA